MLLQKYSFHIIIKAHLFPFDGLQSFMMQRMAAVIEIGREINRDYTRG